MPNEGVTISVPAGYFTETDLMAALEFVVETFSAEQGRYTVSAAATARAVDWLASKYGSRALPG